MPATFKKGDLVRLNPYWSNALKVVPHRQRTLGWRHLTAAEREKWYEDFKARLGHLSFNDTHDSAGEPRLAPQFVPVDVQPDGVWVVERARCAPTKGYVKVSGCAQLLELATGISFYIRREMLVPV